MVDYTFLSAAKFGAFPLARTSHEPHVAVSGSSHMRSIVDHWLQSKLCYQAKHLMKPHIPSLKFLLLLLVPICLIWCRPAHACGGDGCGYYGYSAIEQAYDSATGCLRSTVSMAMLSPGNDTRVNLMLLMSDMPSSSRI